MMKAINPKPIALAFTGASGIPYGLRLLEHLVAAERQIYLMISPAAQTVFAMETNLKIPSDPKQQTDFFSNYFTAKPNQITAFGNQQWSAPVASGSNVPEAMIICPCTSGCIGAIAAGISDNLIERAADVVIKENRKLILVHRETPLSIIHLENLLKLARLGAIILPANPGFYNQPSTIQDLIDFIVARILDHLNIPHRLQLPWGNTE
ncbi:MAG: Flavin prenyltransferase UbiX [Legionellaceae bacterium]